MRLIRDTNPGAYAVTVPCYLCGRPFRMAEGFIDLEGPAFRAYYCRACILEHSGDLTPEPEGD